MAERHQGNKAGDVVDDMFGVRKSTGLADGFVEISRHSQIHGWEGKGICKGFQGRYHFWGDEAQLRSGIWDVFKSF